MPKVKQQYKLGPTFTKQAVKYILTVRNVGPSLPVLADHKSNQSLCQQLHLTAVSDIASTFLMPSVDRDYSKTTVLEETVLQAIPQQGFHEHSSC